MTGYPMPVPARPKGLNVVMAMVSVAVAACCAIAVWIGASERDNPSLVGYQEAMDTAGLFGMAGAILIVGNIGLYQRKPWARILVVVLASSGALWTGLFGVASVFVAFEGQGEIHPTWLLACSGFAAAFALCVWTVNYLLSAEGRLAFAATSTGE